MGCRKKKNQSCSCKSDCLCRILREFKNSEITITTKSGDIIMGVLKRVTMDGCVKILEQDMVTPFVSDRLTVIRSNDIESFSVELLQ